jgi:peptidyl-prolyl cis-trans isomerase A (cyclophilin A)
MIRPLSVSSLFLVLAVAACNNKTTQQAPGPALLTPSPTELAAAAPDSFKVQFVTSKGSFTAQFFRAWAPLGVDRFHYLAKNNYYDGIVFFRVLPNFVVQFGIHGDPKVSEAWRSRSILDDKVLQSNQQGFITYAMGGPNTRTTQIFINKRDNSRLDAMGFAPIGKIIDGMHVVEQIYAGYGEGGRGGGGPDQEAIRLQGNAYLNRMFPMLDSIVTARIVK